MAVTAAKRPFSDNSEDPMKGEGIMGGWLGTSGRLFTLLAMVALSWGFPPTAAATPESRIALVIGNATYKDSPLLNPVNDAHDIAARLRQAGFTVMLHDNATKQQMEQAISDFGARLTENTVAMVFYSGHGIQVQGRNFLVPVDARMGTEQQVRLQTLDLDILLDQMAAARSRVNLVVLDACRDNPFEHKFRSLSGGLAQMNAPEGTMIAYATAPGKVASDGEGRNGLYTEELLKAISQPGLAIEEVFKRVRVGVRQRSDGAQTPWESSSLIGDLVILPARSPATPTALAPALATDPGADREALFWESIKGLRNPTLFRAYLDQYPHGAFASQAAIEARDLETTALVASDETSASRGQSQPPAAPSPASPSQAPGQAPQFRREPHPRAFEACVGKQAGEPVQLMTRRGPVATVCVDSPKGLFARPDRRPSGGQPGARERRE